MKVGGAVCKNKDFIGGVKSDRTEVGVGVGITIKKARLRQDEGSLFGQGHIKEDNYH